jgi:SAM-dependent methyltransferase
MLARMETTEAWQLTTADFDAPDVGTVWDLCLSVEYDRGRLVADIADWIGAPEGVKVLDAACGSGFPALELHRMGYDVTCTDGSPPMLERFRATAQAAGIELGATVALWQELSSLYSEQFDVVICRGCSLTYAGTFDADVDPDRSAVEDSIKSFAGCLRPGGRLYIDVPREEDLGEETAEWDEHPTRVIDGHQVDLRERITAEPAARLRRWEVELEIDDASLALERRSHYMPHAELLEMMREAGLEDNGRADIPSERYAVLTGRKP